MHMYPFFISSPLLSSSEHTLDVGPWSAHAVELVDVMKLKSYLFDFSKAWQHDCLLAVNQSRGYPGPVI